MEMNNIFQFGLIFTFLFISLQVKSEGIEEIDNKTAIDGAVQTNIEEISRGLEIFQKVDNSQSGYGSSNTTVEMILYDKNGKSRSRKMRFQDFESNLNDKSLIVFEKPKKEFGITLLTKTYTQEEDKQWLYLPNFNRTKKISSGKKSSSFVGSEFAFEDISSYPINKFSYEYLETIKLNGKSFYVVKIIPLYAGTGYSKKISWVDYERNVVVKTEFYDKGGEHLKTLTSRNFRQYPNRQWRAAVLEMENHKTGRRTELNYEEYTFCEDCSGDDVDQYSLDRI